LLLAAKRQQSFANCLPVAWSQAKRQQAMENRFLLLVIRENDDNKGITIYKYWDYFCYR
jgi:hypothetical protein